MTDDFRRSVENADGSYPESWVPEKVGDMIVGTLVGQSEGETKFGRVPIAVIKEEDTGEKRSVWLMGAVLQREFERANPRGGERIAIKRVENRSNEYGPYKCFVVKVDRADEEQVFNWSSASEPVDMPRKRLDYPDHGSPEPAFSSDTTPITHSDDDLPFSPGPLVLS